MKQRLITLCIGLVFTIIGMEKLSAQQDTPQGQETVFVWGGDIDAKFVEYIAGLTRKENPKIAYLPTASADSPDNIKYWETICNALKLDTIVLKVWVSSSDKNRSFEDVLLHSDAIVVGGGNTLNMLGIWKAQGIDTILEKALKKGIVLSGGSAGSICWFQSGISDSRPVHLSIVEGLGFLSYSNCPHYSQTIRKELYHQMMLQGKIGPGYATDELAGVLFRNGKAVEFVSQSDVHHSYFVAPEQGQVQSTRMKSKIVLSPKALSENAYTKQPIKKKIGELLSANDNATPLNAYISEIKTLRLGKADLSESEKKKVLGIGIEKIFTYQNKLAGVVNDAYLDSFGYGVWYFYNCKGSWVSMGEDIGGNTLFESEITFREKAEAIIGRAKDKLNCP